MAFQIYNNIQKGKAETGLITKKSKTLESEYRAAPKEVGVKLGRK
jgi:hypothetical protein